MHRRISNEYVIKIRYPGTPLSHFVQAGHPMHTKISGEYVIKKRWLRVSDSRFKNYLIPKLPSYRISWPHAGLKLNETTDSFKKTTRHITGLFVVHVLGRILKYIPGVQEGCNKKVRRDPCSLEFVSDCLKTREMCERAAEDEPDTLEFIPDHLKTQDMCGEAVNIGPWLFGYFPGDV